MVRIFGWTLLHLQLQSSVITLIRTHLPIFFIIILSSPFFQCQALRRYPTVKWHVKDVLHIIWHKITTFVVDIWKHFAKIIININIFLANANCMFKVQMTTFRYIMVPICVPTTSLLTGQHWILLVADTTARTVAVVNSVPNLETEEHYIQLFKLVCLYTTSSSDCI